MVPELWNWLTKLLKVLNKIMKQIVKLPYLISICSILLFNSCGKEEAQIPSYLNIDHFDLVTTEGQGSDSHKISVVWITVGPDLIGPFELPCTVPILKEGVQEITLKAGIRINGIAATRMIYPPFNIDSQGSDVLNSDNEIITEVNLVRDSIVTLNGRAKYHDEVAFLNIEDFEGIGTTMDTVQLSDSTKTPPIYTADFQKVKDSTLVFEGESSGYIGLTEEKHEFILKNVLDFPIPTTFGSTFIELNYKNEAPITVGYVLKGEFGSIIRNKLILTPTDEWNKVYVSISPLEDISSNNIDAESFYIYVRGVLTDDLTTADIYLDNIKLISK